MTVTTTTDGVDANLADGVCRSADNQCSLRAAIEQSNATTGPNRIEFSIPGGGVKRITPATRLPPLNDQTGATTIDGYTQSGAAVNTANDGSNAKIMVELVGAGLTEGIRIESAGNTVRGLSITGFSSNVYLVGEAADGNRIVGNFVGPLANGNHYAFTATTRYTFGVHLALGPDRNEIGAPTLADRNVISGNGTWGVSINHGETTQNFVQNNVIGLRPDLQSNLPQRIGIDLQWWTSGNLIGGGQPLERNLISGNNQTTSNGFHGGVDMSHDALQNQVIGNYIGTLANGDSVAPHTSNTQGMLIKDNANDNYIADNVIANSLFDGIKHRHNYSGGNVFVGNRIGVGAAGSPAGNGMFGINLNGHDMSMIDNLIANNGRSGIKVVNTEVGMSSTTRYPSEKTVGNALRQNTFYRNEGGSTTAPLVQVDAQSFDQAVAVDSGERIYRFVNGSWQEVGGRLVHVSVGADGSMWGVNSANNVYRRAAGSGSWELMPDSLTLVQVDAQSFDQAVAVDSGERIYRFVNGAWQEVGGRLVHVSVGADGSMWGVNSANNVYRRAAGSGWALLTDTVSLGAIDIHPGGPNVNDPGDQDDGPHLLLNTPELSGMGWVNNRGEVYGTACAGCVVEIYGSGTTTADGLLNPASAETGIGQSWLGTVTARPDGTFSFQDSRLRVGKSVSALAIDSAGNTSEMVKKVIPSSPIGIQGNPMTSQARLSRPTAPARPQRWASPTITSVGGQVTDAAGNGVGDMTVDLFDEGRNNWLGSAATNNNGDYSFGLTAGGCYAVTFIADSGQTFASSRSQWSTSNFCVAAGETNDSIDATLAGASGNEGTIGDRVTRNGAGVSGVSVELWTLSADGARGTYLEATVTDGAGSYRLTTSSGCYAVTFIAPSGTTFENNGSRWYTSSVCLDANETVNTVDAILN